MSADSTATQIQLVEEIYSAHHGWLRGWIRKKLNCPEHAADLAHDTFLRLLSSEESLTLKQPRAYLLVVANRLLINRYRRKKVEDEVLRQVSVFIEQQDRRGPEEITSARQLLAQAIFLLTEDLAQKPRDAFLMARVEGLTYKQIARRLGVSESSVKQYIAKVMIHCHSRLYTS
ncbi:RNA polymerase subunit sigma [Methylophaga sp. 41_12_T18]|nr:RNA polymerase subunit sigma [Methylophaga sp. 41_12_T18]